ncbi:MAG: hypothetical protein J5772_03545 [Clostridia bacterium]|nr:hypothetical protein [Clostridia bacterium]
MILDISDSEFRKLFDDKELFLPQVWDGSVFYKALKALFDHYLERVNVFFEQHIGQTEYEKYHATIRNACDSIHASVKAYLDGFPARAFETLFVAMKVLMRTPLKIYYKSSMRKGIDIEDSLCLYRAACVNDIKPYDRSRMFHAPFNLRSKVPTCRYSIAGYPSLYLGTSLELCCEEIHVNPGYDRVLASMFKLERSIEQSNTDIKVIELGIKPQDFIENNNSRNKSKRRCIDPDMLHNDEVRTAYLLWYPLIAACSFIRTNKNDPFAAEYIIPQLLMQWVRAEMSRDGKSDCRDCIDCCNGGSEYCENYTSNRSKKRCKKYDQLIGIRYFSCASKRASDLGFNYVFPTSGEPISENMQYCCILSRAFKLTVPQYMHDFDSINTCERILKSDHDLRLIC